MPGRAPPPPQRKNPPMDYDQQYDQQQYAPVGNHLKMIRQLSPPSVAEFDPNFVQNTQPQFSNNYEPQSARGELGVGEYDLPETTIGATVSMKGDISFNTLLRIDGSFEGKLTSTGNIIIGTTGVLVGNVLGMNEVVVQGRVVGDIQVESLELKATAQIFGNITAKKLSMEGGATVVGQLNVNPYAPERVNTKGELAVDEEQPAATPEAEAESEAKAEAAPEPEPVAALAPAPAPAPVPAAAAAAEEESDDDV